MEGASARLRGTVAARLDAGRADAPRLVHCCVNVVAVDGSCIAVGPPLRQPPWDRLVEVGVGVKAEVARQFAPAADLGAGVLLDVLTRQCSEGIGAAIRDLGAAPLAAN